MAGSARIAALSTAAPSIQASANEVWEAMGRIRGRRMPKLSTEEGARMRRLAEPLSSLMEARTQSQQTDAYLHHARALARQVCCEALASSGVPTEKIGLIIGVSCTGVVLPSLDAELIPVIGLREDVARLPITELGCGAGLAGLARALDYLKAYPDRAVLLFAVELPSLTFQPDDHSVDNLVAALVFGDGAGAIVLEGGGGSGGWTLQACATRLVPAGARQLGFELRDGGLRVVLSRDLPKVVEANLAPAVKSFLDETGTTLDQCHIVAAHPGGPRIFAAVERALRLAPESLNASRRVFQEFGNASSAGIFFVLRALQEVGASGKVLAIAFGPGLSIELALLELNG